MGDLDIGGSAFLLSNGILGKKDAKTSHGLIRCSGRFYVKAVIDQNSAGKDAGEVVDGIRRNIPVFGNLEDAVRELGKADYCVVGVATKGGSFTEDLKKEIKKTLSHGISVVNGLHTFLNDQPEFQEVAFENGARLIDVRKPKSTKELKFWSKEIFNVKCPIIAVLGMDCAIGKRTAAVLLKMTLEKVGIKAELIYTGQTGWMQGFKHGFILDSTVNDFISGELAHAILSAYKQENPDLILLEGQSSLRNPSGPCGSEFLLSGNAKKVILVHEPARKYYDNNPAWGKIPAIANEIKLINFYGSEVIALMLNTTGLSSEEADSFRESYRKELGIPVILTLEEGADTLIQHLLN